MLFSSSKEINVNESQTLTIEKNWSFQNLDFLGKKIWRNAFFELSYAFLLVFALEIKGFYQRSLRNEVDFRDIMNVSQNILAKY